MINYTAGNSLTTKASKVAYCLLTTSLTPVAVMQVNVQIFTTTKFFWTTKKKS